MKKIFYTILLCLSCLTVNIAQVLHTQNKDLPCLDKKIQLQIHVALDSLREPGVSQGAINSAISGANQMFSPLCVSFAACSVDTIYNYNFDSIATLGELGEQTGIFNKTFRLNVYIVSELHEPEICGFASSAIHLKKGCLGSLTHELGHFFGLPHTFAGNGNENVDGSNCETAGDGICDTPADPFDPDLEDEEWADGCEFTWLGLDANGQFYQPDMGNIMSYYGCDCGFTRGQYLKMASSIMNSNLW